MQDLRHFLDHGLNLFPSLRSVCGHGPYRIHDLRHAFATLLIGAGVELQYVQQQLGHHSASFTLAVYGHLLPRDRHGEVNRLDDPAPTCTLSAPCEVEEVAPKKKALA